MSCIDLKRQDSTPNAAPCSIQGGSGQKEERLAGKAEHRTDAGTGIVEGQSYGLFDEDVQATVDN